MFYNTKVDIIYKNYFVVGLLKKFILNVNFHMEKRMSISYLKIENYKSIKKVYIEISEINALIGKNGSGKSNIISAIYFFYENLNKSDSVKYTDIFDKNNKYSNEVRITIGYNLERLKKRCYENIKNTPNSKYMGFYKDVIRLSDTNNVELTMIVLKNKNIMWNKPFSERKLIYNLYPMYVIDTRKINLVDWENLWLQIGDLGKLEEREGKKLKKNVRQSLTEYSTSNKVYERIENLFDKNSIKIKKYSPKQLAAITARLYFGGSEFEFNDNKLIFFSDGTNTYNYIKTFVQILSILTEIKIKEPILVLDEPEISLHHNYIDYIFETIFSNSTNIEFILSTHSARMIKNILVKNSEKSVIYHVKMYNFYTNVRKMKLFEERRESVRITDQHANAYFSQMVVCVEGATELELLQNPFLKLLYPILHRIDVMPGMSEEVERKIISPSERKYSVPIMYAIDMDKILSFNKDKQKLELKRSTLINTDKYSYTKRRRETVNVKKRISTMVEKCAFRYKMPIFFCNDRNFNELKALIKKYYLIYDYFVMDTTIEGLLINKNNVNKFLSFLMDVEKIELQKVQSINSLIVKYHDQEKLNIYRILCEGKCDLLMGISELKKNNPSMSQNIKDIYKLLEKHIESKTNGWVSRWIEYFICKEINIEPFQENSYNKVKSFLCTDQENSIRVKFANYFEELDNWIFEISQRYKET